MQFVDVWRGQERVWEEHPSGKPSLRLVVGLNGEDVHPRKYQARTIEQFSHGQNGPVLSVGFLAKIKSRYIGRGIFEIDPGLGKSRIAIEILKRVDPNLQKILVVCSKKALNTWRREYPKWFWGLTEDEVVVVEGDPIDRRIAWEREGKVYVVTYQSGANDDGLWQRHGFKAVIFDECKLFVNRNTKMFKYWSSHATLRVKNTFKYVLLLEGTLVKKGPQDLWGCLHIVDTPLFGSYWKFVNTFCNVLDLPFGKMIVGPKNTEALGTVLRPRFVRLKDKNPEIAAERPPLTRDFLDVQMTPTVRKVYNELTNDLMALTPSGELIITPSSMGLIMKQRQLLVCPAIFDETLGLGAAMDDFFERYEDDPHPVLFTPFKKAIPHILRGFASRSLPRPYVLVGGTDSKEVKRTEEAFNSVEGQERACIVTIKFAESFELWTAKRCFFNGFEWAQRENYQAEKRLHRLITPHPVQSWYYRYPGTADGRIIEVLNNNTRSVNITFQDYIRITQEPAST